MAPQFNDIDDDEPDYPQTSTDDEPRKPTVKPFGQRPYSMASETVTGVAPGVTNFDNRWDHPKYPFTGPPPRASVDLPLTSSSSAWITETKATPLGDGVKSSQLTTSPFIVSTEAATPPSYTSGGYGYGRPDWQGAKEEHNLVRKLVPPIVTTFVVLVFICILAFYIRHRKRRRQKVAATQKAVQEMKIQSQFQPWTQPYVAHPPAAAPGYLMPPSNPSAPPIILGPIPSGANGAYFTGIDTSDMISMTSASNLRPAPPNPFSDNDSLTEPPPPYRPRSAAPPSLTNSSRHSSFRASVVPPTTSRTHLIERSPFEDPEDDDVVSDLSGPTAGQREDAMSAVSDLSYQNDPVVNRSAL